MAESMEISSIDMRPCFWY